MKYFIFILTMLAYVPGVLAQQSASEIDMDNHKIVFQLTSADTTVHKMLLRQLANLMAAAPNSEVMVVCLGPGIDIMRSGHTIVESKIVEMKSKGIGFAVCENTLKERKVMKEEILPEASFVRAGILEIVKKQEAGWSYIRAGQ